MSIDQLIERLKIYSESLENGGKTEILLVEHGFSQNAVSSYIRKIEDWDINLEKNLDTRDLVFSEVKEGVLIGVIPKYVKEENKV